MSTKATIFFLFTFIGILASLGILAEGGNGQELIPTPASPPPVNTPTVASPAVPVTLPDFQTGRRLSVKLEVASAVVWGHFRARLGKGQPATWLADSVRRKSNQLKHGFIDQAPPEFLLRNMLQICADVDELLNHVGEYNLQSVQRNIPKQLRTIDCTRNELVRMMGIEIQ